MKNADMPAMPLFNNNGSPVHHSSAGMDNHGVMAGLTKREMMAIHAPDLPDWFRSKWSNENKSNAVFFTQLHEGFSGLPAITYAGSAAMYFSWRAQYADALLAELERTNGQ